MGVKQLRILYVGNAASVHTQRWVNWFANDHTVALLSIPPIQERPTGLDSQVELLPISFQSRVPVIGLWRAYLALRAAIASWKPDIIHAHLLVPNAWLVAASGFHPYVTTAWGSDVLRATGWGKFLNRWATRQADLNTGDSRELLAKLQDYGCRENQVALIQWGVDTNLFQPGPKNTGLAKQLGLPDHRPILLSSRILNPLYNITTIVQAFLRLATQRTQPILVISRYDADPKYESLVRSLVKPIGDRVFFIAGVSYTQMPDLYRLADVIVTVPSSDSTAVTLLESMASGNLVVSSELPSVKEWITPGRNGYLVPPGDADRLATAMSQALDVPADARESIVRLNRDIINQRASQNTQMKNMEERYLKLVNT